MVLTAWFIATGAQWDLVQTFGWVRMVANYSRTMPFAAAVQETFSGEMCGVCKAVQQAKQQETRSTLPGSEPRSKIFMTFQAVPGVVLAKPDTEDWPMRDDARARLDRSPPPTPPPRVA